MARTRKASIAESPDELKQIESKYRGRPQGKRLQVLRLLAERPETSIEEAARHVGYSMQAVKRWLRIYRQEGLDALLAMGSGGRRAVPDADVAILKRKLAAGEILTVDDVIEWAEEQRAGKAGNARRGERKPLQNRRPTGAPTPLEIPERVLEFLTSLPMTHSIGELVDSLRQVMQSFLGDVDRVSISINTSCDLVNPHLYQPSAIVSQGIYSANKSIHSLAPTGIVSDDENRARILDWLNKSGFPFKQYHSPHVFVFYYPGGGYLGAILLWRECSKTAISSETLAIVEGLHQLWIYILSDAVARYQVGNPVAVNFDHSLTDFTRVFELTPRERHAVILLLLGVSNNDIAGTLNISINTVHYHLRSIYRKTGTHSQAELLAKYFTPRFDPDKSHE